MTLLKRALFLLTAIAALIVAYVGFAFTSENAELVVVVLSGVAQPAAPLGVVIIIAAAGGVLLGLVVGLLPLLQLNNQNRTLRRRLSRRELELNHLRTAAVKD